MYYLYQCRYSIGSIKLFFLVYFNCDDITISQYLFIGLLNVFLNVWIFSLVSRTALSQSFQLLGVVKPGTSGIIGTGIGGGTATLILSSGTSMSLKHLLSIEYVCMPILFTNGIFLSLPIALGRVDYEMHSICQQRQNDIR